MMEEVCKDGLFFAFIWYNNVVSYTGGIAMNNYVVAFEKIDQTNKALVGGKGANLGECAKISGVQVPTGFCLTTEAYQKAISENEALQTLLHQLSAQKNHKPRPNQ